MRIVVVGIGKVGSTVAECLSKEGHEVTVIDQNPQVVEYISNHSDVYGVCGNGAALEVQLEAGVNKADLFISMTSLDELNILCCIMARKNGAQHVIARVRNPDYYRQMPYLQQELGLSMAVNPEMEVAHTISRTLRYSSANNLEVFAKGRLEMAEITLPDDSPLAGMQLCDIQSKLGLQLLVCAVDRGGEVIIPEGSFRRRAGDHITFTCPHEHMRQFLQKAGLHDDSPRSVLLVGGGRIAFYLAKELLSMGMQVKIIEHKKATCEHLGEILPEATILCGDGTDHELLLEEGIARQDACVSLTGVDEENILVSMFAMQQHVKKVITKVSRPKLMDITRSLGLESVVSSRTVTSDRILRYVRAISNAHGSSVQRLYRLLGGNMEALEFRVGEHASFTNKTLQELQFKKGVLIAGIVRGGRLIHPQGSDVLLPGDLVTLVTTLPGVQDLGDVLVEGDAV